MDWPICHRSEWREEKKRKKKKKLIVSPNDRPIDFDLDAIVKVQCSRSVITRVRSISSTTWRFEFKATLKELESNMEPPRYRPPRSIGSDRFLPSPLSFVYLGRK